MQQSHLPKESNLIAATPSSVCEVPSHHSFLPTCNWRPLASNSDTMAQSTLSRFKSFDAYAKTLDDFRVKTTTGAAGTALEH